jgi:hypothetical protein
MMTLNTQTTQTAGAVAHRQSGTPKKRARKKPLSGAEVRRAVRKWEVQVLLEEVQCFGLRPPPGLKSVLDLFIDGRITQLEIQAYLDRQLALPVSSLTLDLELHHA